MRLHHSIHFWALQTRHGRGNTAIAAINSPASEPVDPAKRSMQQNMRRAELLRGASSHFTQSPFTAKRFSVAQSCHDLISAIQQGA